MASELHGLINNELQGFATNEVMVHNKYMSYACQLYPPNARIPTAHIDASDSGRFFSIDEQFLFCAKVDVILQMPA